MRFHVFASDYDGTLARNGKVSHDVIEKVQAIKSSNRTIVLVTGRELPDLKNAFPEYTIFDFIVAENGALIYTPSTGKEELLGETPDENFIKALQEKGVNRLSVGKVIVATWEPFQNVVLQTIKKFGIERQIIFNKGAVMILPPGINKATGLQSLLNQLHFSSHNLVVIGDAENDSAMMLIAECAVAVNNALPSLKQVADFVTTSSHEKGVIELADMLLENDLDAITKKQIRHNISLGKCEDGNEFSIRPYRPGILLTGSSGGGKSTFTVSITESLANSGYQFCLIDPEGDYLELSDTLIIGNKKAVPELREIIELLKTAKQNVVICILSIPLHDRPAFFLNILPVINQCRNDYGHPHWLLIDEVHHLVPKSTVTPLFEDLNNFILIGHDVEAIATELLKKTRMIMVVGKNIEKPLSQYCKITNISMPKNINTIELGQVYIYDIDNSHNSFVVNYTQPQKIQERHKRKYAFGEMGDNNFVFTGENSKLSLKANNLAMFVHIAQGIDDDTWLYHLKRNDYIDWFSAFLHDNELAEVAAEAGKMNAAESKRLILDFITKKYLA